MKLRILSIFIIILLIISALCGCKKEPDFIDRALINDNTFKIGLLFSKNNDISSLFKSGIEFASDLAEYVKISDNDVKIQIVSEEYSDSNDCKDALDRLSSANVGAVIFDGYDLESTKSVNDDVAKLKIPTLCLSSYASEPVSDSIFTLSIPSEYLASCAATFAMENHFPTSAIILESDSDYYKRLGELYKTTVKSYADIDANVYYVNGESANYSTGLDIDEYYDLIVIACNNYTAKDIISDLKSNNSCRNIMLTEVFDKSQVTSAEYDGCYYINKYEEDSSNNISVIFNELYSEYKGVSVSDISSAEAYGYDAYMMIYEALKSFSVESSFGAFLNTTVAESTGESKEVTLISLTEAIKNISYYGVTDIISFKDNKVVTTYIYVDNIINSKIERADKYLFNSSADSN